MRYSECAQLRVFSERKWAGFGALAIFLLTLSPGSGWAQEGRGDLDPTLTAALDAAAENPWAAKAEIQKVLATADKPARLVEQLKSYEKSDDADRSAAASALLKAPDIQPFVEAFEKKKEKKTPVRSRPQRTRKSRKAVKKKTPAKECKTVECLLKKEGQ